MKVLLIILLAICALQENCCTQIPVDSQGPNVKTSSSNEKLHMSAIKDFIIKLIQDLENKVKSIVNQIQELIEALRNEIIAIRNEIKAKIQKLKEDFENIIEEMGKMNEKVKLCVEAQDENMDAIIKNLIQSEEVCQQLSKEEIVELRKIISKDVEDIKATIKEISDIVKQCLQEENLGQITCLVSNVRHIEELAALAAYTQITVIKRLSTGLYKIQQDYRSCVDYAHSVADITIKGLLADIKECAKEV